MAVDDAVANLQGTGFYSLVLPFLLVFAIVYGVLSSLELFDGNNKANVIISLVIGIFAAVYFPMGAWLAFLEGPWAMWLVLILMVLITLELVGLSPTEGGKIYGIRNIIGLVALLGVLALFLLDPSVIEAIFNVDVPDGGVAVGAIPIIGGIIAAVGGLGTVIALAVVILLVAWVADLLPGGNGGGGGGEGG